MYLSVRRPLVALSKTKCNTFCRKVPPAKIYQHLATQERAVVTTMRDVLCSIRTIAQRLCLLRQYDWLRNRRGQILAMQSIHIRPPKIEDRLVPGQWKSCVIKGAGWDRLRGDGRHHQDRRRKPRRRPQR